MMESIPVLLLLAVLSYIDIKKREVPHCGVLALFLYVLITTDRITASLFWGIYAFGGSFLVYLITKGGMGGGDVKILSVLGFYWGPYFPVYLGFLSLTAGMGFVLTGIVCNKLKVSLPLVPFMLLAHAFTWLYHKQ